MKWVDPHIHWQSIIRWICTNQLPTSIFDELFIQKYLKASRTTGPKVKLEFFLIFYFSKLKTLDLFDEIWMQKLRFTSCLSTNSSQEVLREIFTQNKYLTSAEFSDEKWRKSSDESSLGKFLLWQWANWCPKKQIVYTIWVHTFIKHVTQLHRH